MIRFILSPLHMERWFCFITKRLGEERMIEAANASSLQKVDNSHEITIKIACITVSDFVPVEIPPPIHVGCSDHVA